MGTDKALLTLTPGGRPLAGIALDAVRRVADDVFLVAPVRPEYADLGAPLRPDLYGETGALGGIASAIAQANHDACLVVSCDMPFLNPLLLRWMADLPRDFDALIPRLRGESRQGGGYVWQTLHATYTKRCLPAIELALAAGKRQTISFLPDVIVRALEEEEITPLDPELRSFFSVNTPEALAVARGWVEGAAARA
jgi:molybdopterin-guanine dinucleotide biosynthesis protein A